VNVSFDVKWIVTDEEMFVACKAEHAVAAANALQVTRANANERGVMT
jgi:hypothetical protein